VVVVDESSAELWMMRQEGGLLIVLEGEGWMRENRGRPLTVPSRVWHARKHLVSLVSIEHRPAKRAPANQTTQGGAQIINHPIRGSATWDSLEACGSSHK
jgi:hypothetical protein